MNIVYVTWCFAQSENAMLESGIGNYLYKISKYMQRRGHSVTIVVAGNETRRWQFDGIPVYTVKIPFEEQCRQYEWGEVLVPIFRELAFNNALRKINAETPIGLVQYTAGVGTGLLYSKKYPAVLRVSSYFKFQYIKPSSKIMYKVYMFNDRMVAKRFPHVFVPSRSMGDPLSKDIGKKVVIIHTPFEMEQGLEEDQSIYIEKLRGKKYFLFFGRLHPDKGTRTIARCIHEFLERNPDYFVCFAGPIKSEISKRQWNLLKQSAYEYKDRLIYIREMRHSQLYPVIRNAECVLMPSISDFLPNACLEALALNGIVIGTRGASFDEIFEDEKSGFLIDPDNSMQLLQKMERVISMTDREKELMRSRAGEVLQNFTFDRLGGKLEKYYKYIIRCEER